MTGGALLIALLVTVPALAHGVVGKRFFPSALATEDPFVSDELSLLAGTRKEEGEGVEGTVVSTEFSVEYSKRITPSLALSVATAYRFVDAGGGGTADGWDNLEVGFKYQFLASASHETVVSVGLETSIGNTGDRSVGAEEFTVLSPAFFLGKGFGDLPASFRFLRPLALTSALELEIPTRGGGGAAHSGGEGTEHEGEERHPLVAAYGFTVQYSLSYLQSFVRDLGLVRPLNRMILLVEFPLETALNRGSAGDTAGSVNPGVVWVGRRLQLGVELEVPLVGRRTGDVGVLVLVHFLIDDIFPRSLGRPLIR